MTPAEAPPRAAARPVGDLLFRWLCTASGAAVLTTAAALVAVLVWQSLPLLVEAGKYQFFTSDKWVPNPPSGTPIFGAWAFVYGTLVSTGIAMLLAVPLGVASAAFLAEIAPGWLRRVGSFLIELLAAIPSVVYGFWGFFFLAPVVQQLFDAVGGPNNGGTGLLTAGLVLAVMIVPYITAISFDVIRAVPQSQREGALALGATRWQMVWTAVLPYARPGIIAAGFLALGRALGETMAVTMVCGNRAEISLSPYTLGDTIASVIANQLNEADSDKHRAALVALALVLFAVTTVVNVLGRLFIGRIGRSGGRRRPFVSVPSGSVPQTEPKTTGPAIVNRVMTGVMTAALALTLGPLFLILGYIALRGGSAVDANFFTQLPAPPGDKGGGLAHALVGSGVLVALASLLAVPVGVLASILLSEYRDSRLGKPVRFIAELLGGVPSIVIGIFAYALVVRPFSGFSAYAGAAALAVIMLPIVVRASEEALRLVPRSLRDASYALGATHAQTILRVVVPAGLPGIITGICLSISRIAGETAPLLLTAFGSDFFIRRLSEPTPFLPKYIYSYSQSAQAEEQRLAWAAALVLLAVVMLLNVGIRLATGRRDVRASRAG